MLPQNWQLQPPTGGIQSNQSLQAACQQKIRLQSLQMERERLKQRQQEIMRQVSVVTYSLFDFRRLDCATLDIHVFFLSLQQEMMRQSTTDVAMDPFLSGINEQHARQESADSGLGLGSAYSLPQASDDFLNIDENMDGTSGKSGPFEMPDSFGMSSLFFVTQHIQNPSPPSRLWDSKLKKMLFACFAVPLSQFSIWWIIVLRDCSDCRKALCVEWSYETIIPKP